MECEKMGPSKTKVWNSPFSPQGSTLGGRSAKKDASSSRPGVDADSDGAEPRGVEFTDKFAGVALPDGEQGLHVDPSEIFLTVEAEVFQENVAEGDAANSLFQE